MRTITIPARYCGPPTSGNGGYSAGSLAAALLDDLDAPRLGTAVEVTLLAPPPLEQPLAVETDPGARAARLLDGEHGIATAKVLDELVVDAPEVVTFSQAERLEPDETLRKALAEHPFPSCYVCGPDRDDEDALHLWAIRVPGSDVFAAPYVPNAIGTQFEHVWGALDCPSSGPMMMAEAPFPSPSVLGRIAAVVHRVPVAAERHVVHSWRIAVDGRKMHSGSALIEDRSGEIIAAARATWVQLRT